MTYGRLTLRHVCCLGPEAPKAIVHFKAGANAVIGLSNTGKSYVLDLVDFMLGAEEMERTIPQAEPYDVVSVGWEHSDGRTYTLRRPLAGGDAELLDGLFEERTGGTILEVLAAGRKKGLRSISEFYLGETGTNDRVLRKKLESAETQRLTIRSLAPLSLVSETTIIEKRSPVLSGQFIKKTPERSLFKYLLSGVDDSALLSQADETKRAEERRQRAVAGRALVAERRKMLEDAGHDEKGLTEHSTAIEAELASLRETTSDADENLFSARRKRRRLSELRAVAEEKVKETDGLLARFELLDSHYRSDIARLSAIAEAATALDTLSPGPCPLCGAAPYAQKHEDVCEADLTSLAEASDAEINRITGLRSDLAATVSGAQTERATILNRIREIEESIPAVDAAILEAENQARTHRTGYSEVSDRLSDVKQLLRGFQVLRELEEGIANTEKELDENQNELPAMVTPRQSADQFASVVQSVLQAWQLPGSDRVFYDDGATDLQISGQLRSTQGKGIRAVTHAAFVIGLMNYCIAHSRPHLGFVVVDSPLLSYREREMPEENEEDLKQTRVDEAFYAWLASALPNGQVIVIENRDAPPDARARINVHDFMGDQGGARRGFFPTSSERGRD